MKKAAEELERLFQALGDRTRLRLLNLMQGGEVCVCFFVEVLDEPQPKISRHLAYLRSAGLVTARREGKWMQYSIKQPKNETAREIFEHALATMAGDPEMHRDRAALMKACCSPRVPDLLKRAPKPAGISGAAWRGSAL
ncbi:MAG TPA: metalloregulator ArsR/SmtB family transcription factor [Thermoanaerobaculia bacterium]|jgi:ArsR family transcriptional regulator|nr:metalloregulator ArsR/SmtB family transcription factor [Thermoanaerobaculia bacterium]